MLNILHVIMASLDELKDKLTSELEATFVGKALLQ